MLLAEAGELQREVNIWSCSGPLGIDSHLFPPCHGAELHPNIGRRSKSSSPRATE